MPGERLRLMDLLDAANISYSVFNNWRAAGLTLPAVRQGRYSYYERAALDRLLEIRDLKERNRTNKDLFDYFHPE